MKFLVSWQLHEGKLHDTLQAFAEMTAQQEQSMMGDKLKLIGRWHDLVRGTGVAIFETDDAVAMSTYALQWNEHMDMDIAIVTDDDEARSIGKGQQ